MFATSTRALSVNISIQIFYNTRYAIPFLHQLFELQVVILHSIFGYISGMNSLMHVVACLRIYYCEAK